MDTRLFLIGAGWLFAAMLGPVCAGLTTPNGNFDGMGTVIVCIGFAGMLTTFFMSTRKKLPLWTPLVTSGFLISYVSVLIGIFLGKL